MCGRPSYRAELGTEGAFGMHDAAVPQRPGDQRRKNRAEAIERFIQEFAPGDNADLLAQMLVTICRLIFEGGPNEGGVGAPTRRATRS